MTARTIVLNAIYSIQQERSQEHRDPVYALRSELLQRLEEEQQMKKDAVDEHLDTFLRLQFITRGKTMNDEYYKMTALGIEKLKDVL